MRQADYGDRRVLEPACIEDDEFGGVARCVDDEAHQPSLIFIRSVVRRNKDEFARMTAGAEVVHLPPARYEVVFVEPARALEAAVRLRAHGIGIAVSLAEPALVDAGKLLRCGINSAYR